MLACRESEQPGLLTLVLEKDPEPSITVQGRLHRPNSVPYGVSGHTDYSFLHGLKEETTLCALYSCSSPSNVLVLFCQDPQARGSQAHAVWCLHHVFGYFVVPAGASLLTLVSFQLMIWRSLRHPDSWLLGEHSRNLTMSKGALNLVLPKLASPVIAPER